MKLRYLLMILSIQVLSLFASDPKSSKELVDVKRQAEFPLYSVAFKPIPGDSNRSQVKALAAQNGYSFSPNNTFVQGEKVLSLRSDGSLSVAKIEAINPNGGYVVRVHEPTKDGRTGIKSGDVAKNIGKNTKLIEIYIPEELYKWLKLATKMNEEDQARLLSWLEENQGNSKGGLKIFELPENQWEILLTQRETEEIYLLLYKLLELNLSVKNIKNLNFFLTKTLSNNIVTDQRKNTLKLFLEKAFEQGLTYDQIINAYEQASKDVRLLSGTEAMVLKRRQDEIIFFNIFDNVYAKFQKSYIKSALRETLPQDITQLLTKPSNPHVWAFKDAIKEIKFYPSMPSKNELSNHFKKHAMEVLKESLGSNYEYLTLTDDLGYTPLLYAVYFYRTEGIKFLIDAINEKLKSEKSDEDKKAYYDKTFGRKTKDGMNAYSLAQFLRERIVDTIKNDIETNAQARAFAAEPQDKKTKIFDQYKKGFDDLTEYQENQFILEQYNEILDLLRPIYNKN